MLPSLTAFTGPALILTLIPSLLLHLLLEFLLDYILDLCILSDTSVASYSADVDLSLQATGLRFLLLCRSNYCPILSHLTLSCSIPFYSDRFNRILPFPPNPIMFYFIDCLTVL